MCAIKTGASVKIVPVNGAIRFISIVVQEAHKTTVLPNNAGTVIDRNSSSWSSRKYIPITSIPTSTPVTPKFRKNSPTHEDPVLDVTPP
jgi:hypothetical protein